jgi:hypothetical protein
LVDFCPPLSAAAARAERRALPLQEALQAAQQPVFAFAREVMLPNSQDPPALRPQSAGHQSIPGLIRGEFLLPEPGIVLRLGGMERSAMPEASIHEHSDAQLGKSEFSPRS